MNRITQYAAQYFRDLKQYGKEHSEENLLAWLWFACDAKVREDVRDRIAIALEEEQEEIDRQPSGDECISLIARCSRLAPPIDNPEPQADRIRRDELERTLSESSQWERLAAVKKASGSSVSKSGEEADCE